MKKLLIASVSILALSAGAAYAQVVQVDQLANMPTTGSPARQGANVSAGNESLVQQMGTGNTISYVDQSNTATGSGNYSEVYQGYNGNLGGAATSASNGNASVLQISDGGSVNSSRIHQIGNGQTANITQNTTGGYNYTSTIEQTSGGGNTANVYQGWTGSAAMQASGGATSTVQQTGNNGVVNVYQYGTGAETSAVVQSGSGDGTTVNVKIDQSGLSTNNSTVWQQSGLGWTPSKAIVTQDGKSAAGTNTSLVWQGSQGSTYWGDSATVTQHADADGLINYSYVEQDAGSTANVTQTASLASNTSSVIQYGYGNHATVNQH